MIAEPNCIHCGQHLEFLRMLTPVQDRAYEMYQCPACKKFETFPVDDSLDTNEEIESLRADLIEVVHVMTPEELRQISFELDASRRKIN